MGLLERYHASPHRQKINNVLMVAGFLSLSVPLLAEGVQFILRFRRRTGKSNVTIVYLLFRPCDKKKAVFAMIFSISNLCAVFPSMRSS